MKISTSTRACIIFFSLLLFCSACKKENFAKDFEGSYNGTAQETIYSYAVGVPNTVNNYSNCNIRVEEVNRFNVRVTITLDIANPSVTRSGQLKILSDKSFFASSGNSRGTPGYSSQGIVTNDSLDYSEMRSIFSQFSFKGKKG
jgi:hypothetical protein